MDIIRPTSLTNTVSPCFEKINFPDCPRGTQTILQLLSHFREHAIHLTHTLLTQRPILLGNDTQNGSVKLAYFNEPSPGPHMLTVAEQITAAVNYNRVVDKIDFMAQLIGDDPDMEQGGCCRPLHNRTFEPHTGLPGCGSQIVVNINNVMNLQRAVSQGNVMAQQYWTFRIAHTLFHELAHAIAYAVVPIDFSGQCFLGRDYTTEIGFEFERRVFGGLIALNPQPDEAAIVNGDIFLHTWPHPSMLHWYNTTGGIQHVFTRDDLSPPSRVLCHWTVPISYLNSLFQDDFWDTLPIGGLRNMGVEIGQLSIGEVDAEGKFVDRDLRADDPEWEEIRIRYPPPYMFFPDGIIMTSDVV